MTLWHMAMRMQHIRLAQINSYDTCLFYKVNGQEGINNMYLFMVLRPL